MNLTKQATTPVVERIAQLRAVMQRAGLDAYLVPSADPHLSEYPPMHWQSRAWLSGFTGSAGTLVVTADFAGLWVDSRYWSQADTQLAGSGITLMKIVPGQAHAHFAWLATQVPAGGVVGVDGLVLSVLAASTLQSALSARKITLRTDLDLFAEIWRDRPALPTAEVFEHPAPYISMTRTAKLACVRMQSRAQGADWHWLSTLDDIAWIFNLRGADVSYNPVFVAYALIGPSSATLFIAPGKVSAALKRALLADGVTLAPYEQAAAALACLPTGAKLLADPRRSNYQMLKYVPAQVSLIETINPSTLLKSRKSELEVAHIRATMEQDGAALCEFFAWFEQALGHEEITELTIDEQLSAARARRPGFVTLSFSTIAGFNANGAMPHYCASTAAHATIAGQGLLLIDSGGQYWGGTTDITRVVPVGIPSAAQKHDFTLVLKGMIALSAARFPRFIRAPMLDALARAPIWAAGVDYGHGTGHGVGYFLNVHEGPHAISHYAAAEPTTAMEAGMITSIEPGIYRPEQWGIRIENLVLTRSAPPTEFGEFLEFETLTLCPIDTRCIEPSLLNASDITWLNDYHRMVHARLAPHVSGAAREWLKARTCPLELNGSS